MKKSIGLSLSFILLFLGFCGFKIKTTVSLEMLIANSRIISLTYCEIITSDTACEPIEITEEDTIINHAQGVSLSCAMLGIDGKVVMPKGAPKSKVCLLYTSRCV